MPKQIQLSIPKPCHENWDAMTPSEKGRFCGSCQKQVMDFTNMSDSQLAAFFKRKSAGSVCGRFADEQLDRAMDVPKKRIPWVKYFFQLTLPLFLASLKANAQKGERTFKQVKLKTYSRNENKDPYPGLLIRGNVSVSSYKPASAPLPDIEIKGSVIGADNAPVPYASIIVKGTTSGVKADSSGGFRITVPSEKEDPIVISVSCVGYNSKDVIVTDEMKKTSVDVKLEVKEAGEAVVVVGYSSRRMGGVVMGATVRISRRMAMEIKNDPLPTMTHVYPNPLPSGSSINIKCDNMEEDYYSLQLISISGQAVFRKEIWIHKEARVLNIALPHVVPGSYLLLMTSRQDQKKFTEKIIILP